MTVLMDTSATREMLRRLELSQSIDRIWTRLLNGFDTFYFFNITH